MGDKAIHAAKPTAVSIVIDAIHIATRYRHDDAWRMGNGLLIPALEFGDFLRNVIEAQGVVMPITRHIIETKRDEQPVQFGGIIDKTAHHVAIHFARQVGSAIWLNLWTKDEDAGIKGTALAPWPIDGLMSDQQESEFIAQWEVIRDELAKIKIGSQQDIIARIQMEAIRAESVPRKTQVIETSTPSAATQFLMDKVRERDSMVDVLKCLYVNGPQTKSALSANVTLSNTRKNLEELKSLGMIEPGTEGDRGSEGSRLTNLGREVCGFLFPSSL
ncbi:MAG: hypothetical protein Q8K78_09095 [Planctomycetaceae bacterium]|nr:hypothetical protein [Planctomycetaceae bacterium]